MVSFNFLVSINVIHIKYERISQNKSGTLQLSLLNIVWTKSIEKSNTQSSIDINGFQFPHKYFCKNLSNTCHSSPFQIIFLLNLGTLLSGSNFLQICDIDPQHWSFLCLWWNVKLITPCRKILHSIDQVGSFNWVWSIAKGVMNDEYGRIDDSQVVKFWAQMYALNFQLSIKYVWKLIGTDMPERFISTAEQCA